MVPRGLAILVLAALILVTQGHADTMLKETPESRDLVLIGGKPYFFELTEKVNWYSAKYACVNLGMQLLTLDNKEKNDLIVEFINQNPTYNNLYWTSGWKSPFDNSWSWDTTKEPFSYTEWVGRNPDTQDGVESCMNFYAGVTNRGWYDDYCSANFYYLPYVCEEKL